MAWRGAVAVAVIGILYTATSTRAQRWGSESGFIANAAENHPQSPSAQYLMGELVKKKRKDPLLAYPYYFKAAQLMPHEAGFLISLNMVTPPRSRAQLGHDTVELVDPTHIADLLRTRPISAWAMRALDIASLCVHDAYPPCRPHTQDVRRWLNAIDGNPKLDLAKQRYFRNRLFRIEMRYGLFEDALETAKRATAHDNGHPEFILMHAEALAALKRLPEATALLDDLEENIAPGEHRYATQLAMLRESIASLSAENGEGSRFRSETPVPGAFPPQNRKMRFPGSVHSARRD